MGQKIEVERPSLCWEVGDQIIVTGHDGNLWNKPNGNWIANITTKDTSCAGYTKATLYFHEHDSKTTVFDPDSPVIVIRNFI